MCRLLKVGEQRKDNPIAFSVDIYGRFFFQNYHKEGIKANSKCSLADEYIQWTLDTHPTVHVVTDINAFVDSNNDLASSKRKRHQGQASSIANCV